MLTPSLMIIKKSQELPLFVNKFISRNMAADFLYDVVYREVFVCSTPASVPRKKGLKCLLVVGKVCGNPT